MTVLEWIYNFFKSFFDFLIDVLVWVLDAIFYILSEPLYLLFDALLVVVEAIFTLLDLSGLALDSVLDWTSLPDSLVWILGEIDLSQGLTIMVSAMGIRMLINLIPGTFTRV
jgi:hypothetical protein